MAFDVVARWEADCGVTDDLVIEDLGDSPAFAAPTWCTSGFAR
ncbi:hypothetical protein [Nonomuraea endophytica]